MTRKNRGGDNIITNICDTEAILTESVNGIIVIINSLGTAELEEIVETSDFKTIQSNILQIKQNCNKDNLYTTAITKIVNAITLKFNEKAPQILQILQISLQNAGKAKSKKLCDCTVKELKERAKTRKVKGYSTMNKAELLAALRRK